jgi:anaerobic selenocysteine-containing dehydrogenase
VATVVRTACPLDCPDACTLDVTVGEDGRLERVEGAAEAEITAGFICAKVRRIERHVYGPERLLHPGVRVGAKGEGRFEAISWEEAYDLVAGRLGEIARRHGGEAILPLSYGGSNGLLSQDTADARLFGRLGASRLARTVCAAPSGRAAAGLYGKMPGVAFPDYQHASLIVVWGANPSDSGIHLVPWIRKAQERGAALVVVDPRRTPLAVQADLHLAPRPGTDLAIALAVIRWLFEADRADLGFLRQHAVGWEGLRERAAVWSFERAGVASGLPARQISRFAELYADASPAVVRCGWGVERNVNGGSAVAAILALPAVAGKFGVRGGGYTMSNSGAWRFEAASRLGVEEPPTRRINMNRVGFELAHAEPPIRALFVYNHNPLATLPHQNAVRRGLERDDLFTVVFDQVLTDTARYADVVLPATTFLEHRDLAKGYGTLVLHRVVPAIAPVGEAKSNVEVFSELTRRLGLARSGDPTTAEACEAAILAGAEGEEDLAARLEQEGDAAPAAGPAPISFVDVYPRAPDGKIHLLPAELDREAGGLYLLQEPPSADPRYPLTLISPASRATISSTFGQLQKGLEPVEMHPEDAGARGLAGGETVRVFNDLGEVRVPLRVTDRVRPGVVALPKGLWSHQTLGGATANALAPDHLTDLGGGACFNDARVEIEKLA